MMDFNWKALLRDATVVGDDKSSQLGTQAASAIFKSVNQRRDNLTQSKGAMSKDRGGGALGMPGAAAAQEQSADPAEYTEAALKAMANPGGEAAAEKASVGFSSSVTRSHYAAGSLYAFTFSEYLEGLLHVALEVAAGRELARRRKQTPACPPSHPLELEPRRCSSRRAGCPRPSSWTSTEG